MVAILGSLAMMGPLTIDMYLPALPAIVTDFQATPSQVQLSLTFYLVGLALGQLLAGPISDMRGRRLPLTIGLLVYAIFSLLCAFSPSIGWLIVFRTIQGFAGAAGIVISRAIVRDLYSGVELTKFFTLLMLVNGAGPIIAPLIGGQVLRFTEWPGIFVVLFGVGLLLLAVVSMRLPETLTKESRSTGGLRQTVTTFGSLLRDREFMGYALASGFITAALFGYLSGSSFVFQSIYGVSAQTFSYIFALNGFGFVLASQITGRLVGRVSELKLLVSGFIVAATGGVLLVIMLLLDAGIIGITPAFFLVVSSVGIVGPTSSSLALQSKGKIAGSAAALQGVLSLGFGAITSPLAGIGGEESALPLGILIATAALGSIVCYLVLIRPLQRKKAETTQGGG